MTNRDLEAAWSYHNATKHSYTSVRAGGHYLDWANQPAPFKIYPRLDPIPLLREEPQTGMAALSTIAEAVAAAGSALPDRTAPAQPSCDADCPNLEDFHSRSSGSRFDTR